MSEINNETKKKGRFKEWLKENWPALVIGSCYAGIIGYSGYVLHKSKKQAKELEEYWQTPEAWSKKADEYRVLAQEAELLKDFYDKHNDSNSVEVTNF